ncbi:Transposase [Phytophthora infestans]|uniref:Transposase n=1 Tax=Phytophthora infestans TaxID=4787 RepID=A0A833TIB4_PHYIN|nr:Transposase [Phytophthora infestans]KAF4150778.1 Transposase [Phytophthora infestans]
MTDVRQDRRIVREVGIEIGKPISRSTIRERIRETGLHGRSARKKPFLSAMQRLAYAKNFLCGNGVGPLHIGEESVNESRPNPIENIWAILKWELNKTPATSLEDLKQKLPKIWYQAHADVGKRAVRSMPKRLDAVKQAKGCHTKY